MFHAVNWGYVGILALKGLGLVAMVAVPAFMVYAWATCLI